MIAGWRWLSCSTALISQVRPRDTDWEMATLFSANVRRAQTASAVSSTLQNSAIASLARRPRGASLSAAA